MGEEERGFSSVIVNQSALRKCVDACPVCVCARQCGVECPRGPCSSRARSEAPGASNQVPKVVPQIGEQCLPSSLPSISLVATKELTLCSPFSLPQTTAVLYYLLHRRSCSCHHSLPGAETIDKKEPSKQQHQHEQQKQQTKSPKTQFRLAKVDQKKSLIWSVGESNP